MVIIIVFQITMVT